MRILTLLLGLALDWAFAAPAHAQTLSEAEVAIVDAAARQAVHEGAPSVSIAIVRNGAIVFARAYGRRALSPDAPKPPATSTPSPLPPPTPPPMAPATMN